MSHVKGVKPNGDKVMRLHAQRATIENGFVRLPEEVHWLADYVSELTAFPASRHDDQVELDRPGARLGQATPVVVRGVDRILSAAGRLGAGFLMDGMEEGCGDMALRRRLLARVKKWRRHRSTAGPPNGAAPELRRFEIIPL